MRYSLYAALHLLCNKSDLITVLYLIKLLRYQKPVTNKMLLYALLFIELRRIQQEHLSCKRVIEQAPVLALCFQAEA